MNLLHCYTVNPHAWPTCVSGPRSWRLETDFLFAGVSVAFSFCLLAHNVHLGLIRTSLLLIFVAMAGLVLVHGLSRRVGDPSIRCLAYYHLLKIPVVLCILFWGWVPDLHPSTADSGYDPQRYYYQAAELFTPGQHYDLLSSINYAGILYYYGSIFFLLGHNPAAPALMNCLTTLVAALVILEACYLVAPRGWRGSRCALVILLPELLWYDAITSRESLTMALLVCGTLPWGMFLLSPKQRTRPIAHVILPTMCLMALGFVRTSMLLPASMVIAGLFVTFSLRSRYRTPAMLALLLVGVTVWILPRIISQLRSFDFGYLAAWRDLRELLSSDAITWSDRSLGQRLVANTLWQEIAYAPLRTALYLIIPLPSITFDWTGLRQGEWQHWQNFLATLSSAIYLYTLPYAVTATYASLTQPTHRPRLLIFLPCWLLLVAVAVGNAIFVARYRIMVVALFWAGVSLYTRDCRRSHLVFSLLWWCAVIAGGVIYVQYKF